MDEARATLADAAAIRSYCKGSVWNEETTWPSRWGFLYSLKHVATEVTTENTIAGKRGWRVLICVVNPDGRHRHGRMEATPIG